MDIMCFVENYSGSVNSELTHKKVQEYFPAGGSRGCPPLSLVPPKDWG